MLVCHAEIKKEDLALSSLNFSRQKLEQHMYTHSRQMQLLLWIEELQHEVDILTYNMTAQQLVQLRHGGLVALKVRLHHEGFFF